MTGNTNAIKRSKMSDSLSLVSQVRLSSRGLKLKYIRGPRLDNKRARGPEKDSKTVMQAGKECKITP